MKFFTVLAFTFVLLGFTCAQSFDPNTFGTGTGVTSEGYDFSSFAPLLKGLVDGFRSLMSQVRSVRSLFENFGYEMGRIARNTTTSSGSILPFPFPGQYSNLARQEPSGSSEPTTQEITENAFGDRFQEFFDRWGQNTAVAFRGLLSEVAHVYQDVVATMVKQGEISRNQVVQGYNTIRSAMTSVSKMITENFPSASSVANSISNISQSLNQNVTNIISGIIPDGLPTGLPTLPTGLPSFPGLPTLPSLPTLPNLQNLIPTTPQTEPSKKNN